MVSFSVFNEKSLPFDSQVEIEQKFKDFFRLLTQLREKELQKIRMDEEFKNYPILENVSLQQFFGQIQNQIFQDRLREFLTNDIVKIETPLIKDEEINDNESAIENEYFYKGQSTFGGLACCDIWNTIAVSFNSCDEWNSDIIFLQRGKIDIAIRHASQSEHLNICQDFFNEIEEELKLEISQNDFWERRGEFFPNKIILSTEVEKQIENLDSRVFQQAMGILRDVEKSRKLITDFSHSGESKTVKQDEALKKQRYFTIEDEKIFFENHIKSLPNANRIYFLEQGDKIFIGYIGKHLPTKKY